MFKKAYILLVVLVTIPFCVYAVTQTNDIRERLVREKTLSLYSVIAGLDQRLTASWETTSTTVFGEKDPWEKRHHLYGALEPILRDYAEAWPGYGFGIYLRDLRIVALIPDRPGLVGAEATPEALRVYASGLTEVGFIPTGFIHGGQSILAVNQPIYHQGQIIGHLWANVIVADIDTAIQGELLRSFSTLSAIWILLLLGVGFIMHDIERSLSSLIEGISRDNCDTSTLQGFPQAITLLKTIEKLRQQLRAEYAERERVAADLAKLGRMDLIGEMAAGLAHEIRNPMTVIRGYLQKMLRKADGVQASQYALILAETGRINEIISAFLSLAKNRRVEMELYNLTDIIFQLFPLIQADARKAGVVVNLQPLPEKLTILADEKEIKQLVLNIVRNAIEALNGKGTVVITAAEQRNFIVLTVADDGCGIDPDLRERIFDPFYTTKDCGTGLGLAICKSIVDRHNGRIDISSEPGIGTAFTIFLPSAASAGGQILAS
jgi:signal transduction histidine kinase